MERGSDLNDTKAKSVVWNSLQHPEWVVEMSHHLHDAVANDLSLTLFHYVDPYAKTNYKTKYWVGKSLEDNTSADDPSYLLSLLQSSYSTIYFKYGYAQSSEVKLIGSTKESEKTADNWFKMYITGVSSSIDPNGVKIDITAVSSLIQAVDPSENQAAYDYMSDTEKRLDKYYVKGQPKSVYNSLVALIKYFCAKNNYDYDLGKLNKMTIDPNLDKLYGRYTSANGEIVNPSAENILLKSASDTEYDLISNALVKIRGYDSLSSPSITYVDEDGTERSTDNRLYYRIFSDWSCSCEDAVGKDKKPKLSVYSNLTMYCYRNPFDYDPKKDGDLNEFKPFLITMGSGEEEVGSLFYNFSTFDKDLFDESQTFTSSNLTKYSGKYYSTWVSGAKTYADIIDMSLNYELISGIAGVLQNPEVSKLSQSGYNDSGEPTYESTELKTNSSVYNGPQLSQLISGYDDFNVILGRIFSTGSITTPGLGKALKILSTFNIYVYISNRLHGLSGKYKVLEQTDQISGGKFTSTLEVVKILSLSGSSVNAPYSTAKATIQDILDGGGENNNTGGISPKSPDTTPTYITFTYNSGKNLRSGISYGSLIKSASAGGYIRYPGLQIKLNKDTDDLYYFTWGVAYGNNGQSGYTNPKNRYKLSRAEVSGGVTSYVSIVEDSLAFIVNADGSVSTNAITLSLPKESKNWDFFLDIYVRTNPESDTGVILHLNKNNFMFMD